MSAVLLNILNKDVFNPIFHELRIWKDERKLKTLISVLEKPVRLTAFGKEYSLHIKWFSLPGIDRKDNEVVLYTYDNRAAQIKIPIIRELLGHHNFLLLKPDHVPELEPYFSCKKISYEENLVEKNSHEEEQVEKNSHEKNSNEEDPNIEVTMYR